MAERNPFGEWMMSKYLARLTAEERREYERLATRYHDETITVPEKGRMEQLDRLMAQRLAEHNAQPTFTEEMREYAGEIAARQTSGSAARNAAPPSA